MSEPRPTTCPRFASDAHTAVALRAIRHGVPVDQGSCNSARRRSTFLASSLPTVSHELRPPFRRHFPIPGGAGRVEPAGIHPERRRYGREPLTRRSPDAASAAAGCWPGERCWPLAAAGRGHLLPAATGMPIVERVSVSIDTVRRGPMIRQVRGLGTLVPEEIRWIAARTDARVERIVIFPGATVEPETVILVLSSPELQQSVLDGDAAVTAAQAQARQPARPVGRHGARTPERLCQGPGRPRHRPSPRSRSTKNWPNRVSSPRSN